MNLQRFVLLGAVILSAAAPTLLRAQNCVNAVSKPHPGAVPAPHSAAPDTTSPAITTISFGAYASGTAISTQFDAQGIGFSGDNPTVVYNNDSTYVGNALIGTPPACHGTVIGTFVDPLTDAASTVDQVSVTVVGLNDVNTTEVTFYSASGAVISSQLDSELPTQVFSLSSSSPRIASFSVVSVAEDPGGWGIASISFSRPTNFFLVDPYIVPGASSGTIPASSVIASIGNYQAVEALGLVADGVSAIIGVVPTPNAEPINFLGAADVTVAQYNPSFLQVPPAAGAGSLTVTPTYDAATKSYYALVLILSPQNANLAGQMATPTIDAFPGNGLVKAEVPLVPTPIVLVHGIWGDSTSLANVQSGLIATTPWNTLTNVIIDPICYSKYVAFNATTDPVSNPANACEQAPMTQMTAELVSLRARLDAAQVAGGGKIDLVGHSMGGLVARSFSATSGYHSFRDRGQGLYRFVVTIDTPELGSALATFLVNNQAVAYNANNCATSSIIWHAGGCSSSDSLGSCLNKRQMPIFAPGANPTTGGVYSLEPGSPNLTGAPLIPAAQLRSVDAIWPDTTSTKSLLRGVLNGLLSALYPCTTTPPNLSGILGTPVNDVIVTQASQVSGASSTNLASLSTLSHSGVPLANSYLSVASLAGYQNYNVLASYAVNDVVACWLKSAGASTCPSTINAASHGESTTEADAGALEVPTPEGVQPFEDDRRIVPTPVSTRVQLASPIEIPIAVLTDNLKSLAVDQFDQFGEIPFSDEKATVVRQEGNIRYIELRPLRLGHVEVAIAAGFDDGAFALKKFSIDVEPPAAAPAKFHADAHTIRVLVMEDFEHAVLEPTAVYPGIAYPLAIDPKFVDYRLLHPGDEQIVRLHDGQIEALRPGDVWLEAHYGGVVDRVHVLVKTKAESSF